MVSPSPLRQRKKERTRTAIEDAALALFSERGFDAVTLTEIADAAEVGHRTLFRYFADKEELLFGDDEAVRQRLDEALAARPPAEHAVTALTEALVDLSALWQDSAEQGRRRQALIAASAPLSARERAKHSAYEHVVCQGLVERGLGEPGARLLARVGVACFHEAVERWLADADPQHPGLPHTVRRAFADIAGLFRAET